MMSYTNMVDLMWVGKVENDGNELMKRNCEFTSPQAQVTV